MNRDRLKNILQENYKRESWIKALQFLSGNKNALSISLEPQQIILTTQKAQDIVKNLYQLGTIKTTDGITLPIFEVELQPNIKIEYNKVGVNQLIKEFILKDAGKVTIATYFYENEKQTEWRFSFISKFGGSDFFDEVEDIETNPKKYTYIFGTPEEHRTALERLYNLEQSRFKLEDFFEAFNVEPVSNNFFKEYKNFYLDFVSYLSSNEVCRKVFKDEKTEDVEKDIRNFVKRLLGRIVFLYFLQKKRWLGASNTDYEDGDTNFLLHLFEVDKEQFYSDWLSKLFFNALNTPDRPNDSFNLSNSNSVCVPFLNGGLFEEHQEPKAHRSLKFPTFLFEELFTFFNGYNFTIYENSPEDHTVAVDPEMLGSIFENLLEDNNDKGTFYTPKEIVHYMTQESLIEYLNTHLKNKDKAQIENLIKNQVRDDVSRGDLKTIETLIDKVKICDPAIGSGAFPMGLLQEIFSLKAYIHFELDKPQKDWHPAIIKQDIIQNSIYGVDLEEGAVDIARLRFWLSLVVDEEKPKPLPNLDYKIMQGNSLLESFEGIPLGNANLFNEPTDRNISLFEEPIEDYGLGDDIKKLMDDYFNPKNYNKKQQIHKAIDKKVIDYIDKCLEGYENQKLIELAGAKQSLNRKTELKQRTESIIKEINQIEVLIESKGNARKKLVEYEQKSERPYFLWHLFFQDVFEQGGFDIVIGNPPYVDSETMVKVDKNERETIKNTYETTTGNWDLFIPFVEKGLNICKDQAHFSYIIPNKLISAKYTKSLKQFLSNNEIIEIRDYSKINVFKEANVYPITLSVLKKCADRKVKMTVMEEINKIDYSNLIDVKDFYKDVSWSKYFFSSKIIEILRRIENFILLKNFSKDIKILGAATVGEAYEIKEKLIDSPSHNLGFKKLVNTGTIDPYISLWGIKGTQYIKHNYSNPIITDDSIKEINETRLNQSNSAKIIIAGMSKYIEAFIDGKGEFLAGKSTTIIIETNDNLNYILPIISSKLYNFYINHKYHSLKMAGGYFNISVEVIRNLPFIDNEQSRQLFIGLSHCLSYLYNSKSINDTIKNEHIAQFFEEVIDGCVFELYFKDHMVEKGINIIELVDVMYKLHFKNTSIENHNSENKKILINEFYKILKNSEVQQRMRLFVSKSPEILKPILQN